MLSRLRALMWADWVWFPEGHSWDELKDHDGNVFPKVQDLWASVAVALSFLVVRWIFERIVGTPLASLLGVSLKPRLSAPPNPTLESHFRQNSKYPTQSSVESLSRQTGCSVRQVQRWFQRRRNQERPSKLTKFQEASWRFTFYLFAFYGGLAVLVDKPWFRDSSRMWENFPKMPLLTSQYWYYMIQLGFYMSLLLSVVSDVKRKDFWEQIVHHVVTIGLLSVSWVVNYIRAGSVILLVHDASDYIMELAKMFNYAGWKRTCNFLFVVFAAVFIVTRLIVFPVWLLFMAMTLPLTRYTLFLGFFLFGVMLLMLQILHVIWAGFILRMVIKLLQGNDKLEDERSDNEETESDEDNEGHEKLKNGHMKNGHVKDGHVKNSHVKDGHVKNGHVKDGHVKNGHVKNGHVKDGHVKNGHAQVLNHRSKTD
uniref:Ceramide synthase 2a n=1 Tax=Oryzias melastigma TaxID=30732 RepID=A0A3B3BKC8_ORYME